MALRCKVQYKKPPATAVSRNRLRGVSGAGAGAGAKAGAGVDMGAIGARGGANAALGDAPGPPDPFCDGGGLLGQQVNAVEGNVSVRLTTKQGIPLGDNSRPRWEKDADKFFE